MPIEPISPELALVDPELGARARAALPEPMPAPARPLRPSVPTTTAPDDRTHHDGRYPLWARLTATLWILVVGILIGGAAIPHAQERPRVVPPGEDATICERPAPQAPAPPADPLGGPSETARAPASAGPGGPLV